MNIERQEFTIKDIVQGYKDNGEDGITGYGGILDIRPPYQREFVYNEDQRKEVIHTIMQKFPLNNMYWIDKGEKNYEILDGQQRTLSFCQYINGDFSFNGKYFKNLTDYERKEIKNYKINVYVCEGNEKEKLEWFKIVNMAGVVLTAQELRNSVYTGLWLSDAKKYFSKTKCPAYEIGQNYLNGRPIRQEYLETVLRWITNKEKGGIEEYMGKYQREPDAKKLWMYYENVIKWVEKTYKVKEPRKEMKGVEWGILYNRFKTKILNENIHEEVTKLMEDDDVTDKKGVYTYVLTREEKELRIRAFSENQKRTAYEKQKGICKNCSDKFKLEEMEADHITPWSEGGKTEPSNLQMLCKHCNRRKSNK